MMTQAEALMVLKTGVNVFLTGEPGSGKTHTVNAYVAWLKEQGIEPAITASTGIAATHIGGMTIHAWSGIGIRKDLTRRDVDHIAQNKRAVERVAGTSVLIIDEVSMLSAAVLSMVDVVCREIRRTPKAFGGLQVVLVGDFFQLPPVTRAEQSTEAYEDSGRVSASGSFAFSSPSWSALNPLVCYLSEQHRQEDLSFLGLLSALRRGAFSESHKALLRTRYAKEARPGVTQLFSHNADVDRINDAALAEIPGTAHSYEMTHRGSTHLIESLKRGCLSPETVRVKEGARVMFTRNDMMGRFVNGTVGVVSGFDGRGFPIVRTQGGRTITVEPDEWHVEDGGKILARISQVPLRLAWAITVHKSQGMSLDAAHMDLSSVFEYGQGYVALSRVRTLSGLTLSGLNQRATEVHPEVHARDVHFRAASERVRETFVKMPGADITKLQNNFVRACGGGERTIKTQHRTDALIRTAPTREVTLALLRTTKSIARTAQQRKLKESTIVSHILELMKNETLSPDEVLTFLPARLRAAVPKIHALLTTMGSEHLAPVYHALKGVFEYDDLRLARALHRRPLAQC